jgi:hypothetical protein
VFPLPLIPSRQPFDVLTVPRKIEGGRGEELSGRLPTPLYKIGVVHESLPLSLKGDGRGILDQLVKKAYVTDKGVHSWISKSPIRLR